MELDGMIGSDAQKQQDAQTAERLFSDIRRSIAMLQDGIASGEQKVDSVVVVNLIEEPLEKLARLQTKPVLYEYENKLVRQKVFLQACYDALGDGQAVLKARVDEALEMMDDVIGNIKSCRMEEESRIEEEKRRRAEEAERLRIEAEERERKEEEESRKREEELRCAEEARRLRIEAKERERKEEEKRRHADELERLRKESEVERLRMERIKELTNGFVFAEGGDFNKGGKVGFLGLRKNMVSVRSFYICEVPVTLELYELVVRGVVMNLNKSNKPYTFRYGMTGIDCDNIIFEFCNRLSDLLGYDRCYSKVSYYYDGKRFEIDRYERGCDFSKNGFRLPTDVEWEFAARGGIKSKGYKYSGSNDINEVAWYRDNSGGSPWPVKMKRPNELGIYDMSGNIWECCHRDNYTHIAGGGSCSSFAKRCTTSYSYDLHDYEDFRHCGFRLARSAQD